MGCCYQTGHHAMLGGTAGCAVHALACWRHAPAHTRPALFLVPQLAWWLERASRLAFLRRTQSPVEAEWALEQKRPTPLALAALELLALLALCWQVAGLLLGIPAAG